jgi:hypothetical protein
MVNVIPAASVVTRVGIALLIPSKAIIAPDALTILFLLLTRGRRLIKELASS